jgi:hypothetical protein
MTVWTNSESPKFTVREISERVERSNAWVYTKLNDLHAKRVGVRKTKSGRMADIYDGGWVDRLMKVRGKWSRHEKSKTKPRVEETKINKIELLAKSEMAEESKKERVRAAKRVIIRMSEVKSLIAKLQNDLDILNSGEKGLAEVLRQYR